MHEVHLAQIGQVAKAFEARAVLDRDALMRVAVDPEPRHQADAVGGWLCKAVRRAAADRGHDSGHVQVLLGLR